MEPTVTPTDQPTTDVNLVSHYKRLLVARETNPAAAPTVFEGAFEGAFETTVQREPDLSDPGIEDRVNGTAAELHRIVKEELGDLPELHEVVKEIVRRGDEALRVLGGEDEQPLRENPDLVHSLEVIVRSDGSRPSFLIKDGDVARTTSPIGSWEATLDSSAERLRDAIACVGRIDVPELEGGYAGTGFLIHPDLILTNRHVLQFAARPAPNGTWTFKKDAAIDFGHEFRTDKPSRRRGLKQVVYCGAKEIDLEHIDHAKLDLALIELEPDSAGAAPPAPLAVDIAPEWASVGQTVYSIGYPAESKKEEQSLLERLFHTTWGFKRLAPGEVMSSGHSVPAWTVAHDATTLGGNSGSVVLIAGRERVAAGLHYGGTRADPRENWGHVFARVLDEPDPASGKSLRDHLTGFGANLFDPFSSPPL